MMIMTFTFHRRGQTQHNKTLLKVEWYDKTLTSFLVFFLKIINKVNCLTWQGEVVVKL
jgi:hypothetical protein